MKLLLALTLLLASCAIVNKGEPGEQLIGNRLNLTIDGGWNQFGYYYFDPAQVWTMDGLPVDQLLVYSGIVNNKPMHRVVENEEHKSVVFRADMTNEDLIAMFQKLLTMDGSALHLGKIEPYNFDGRKGVRFEFARASVHYVPSLIGITDSPAYDGLGFAAIDKGELFALIYFAPRLGFFPRHKERVEAIARSAKIL
jgi:hypothetical protein